MHLLISITVSLSPILSYYYYHIITILHNSNLRKHLFSYVFVKKSTVALLLGVTTLVISQIILTFKHI